VLRGGLTPKHVEVQELLATLVFEPQERTVLKGELQAQGEASFVTPAREFELGLLELAPGHGYAAGGRLEILLQLEGTSRLSAGGRETALARGVSVLVPAGLGAFELEGTGRVARARVPV
jgi:mannose-6-phosphate isomerase